MELTLKRLLEQAVFDEVGKGKTRGYNREEVDDFLDRAVAMATKVETKLTETIEQVRSGGPSSPADVEAEVERQVQARLADAPVASSGPTAEETAEEGRRTLLLAQRTADAAVKEAREDADRILREAQERAASINSEADDRQAGIDAEIEATSNAARAQVEEEIGELRREAHGRLSGEIAELEIAREALRTDASVLERHVEEQRNQIRSSVGELQRLLDDPEGFRLAPAPAPVDHEVPDFGDRNGGGPEPLIESAPAEIAPAAWAPAETEAVLPDPPADDVEIVDVRDDDAADAAVEDDSVADLAPPVAFAPPVSFTPPADLASPASFEEVDHAAPDFESVTDAGPPTAPMAALDLPAPTGAASDPSESPGLVGIEGDDEDAFLAELRKAMADDEPLGPRDHVERDGDDMFGDEDRRGWRFGKKR